jgi:dynein light chain LC8-type
MLENAKQEKNDPKDLKRDIDETKKSRAYEAALESLNKYSIEKDMAEYIKKIFDEEFLPSWQVVVGIL